MKTFIASILFMAISPTLSMASDACSMYNPYGKDHCNFNMVCTWKEATSRGVCKGIESNYDRSCAIMTVHGADACNFNALCEYKVQTNAGSCVSRN